MPKFPTISGKVWKFGNNISTTDITPHEMFGNIHIEPEKIAFATIRPEWRVLVKAGDCIVAGENFGFGSHRAAANDLMKHLKIGCIVADSIARLYYRGAIAIGFPSLACPGVSKIFQEGDRIELDIYKSIIWNTTTNQSVEAKPYPPQLLELLESGGMLPAMVKRCSDMAAT